MFEKVKTTISEKKLKLFVSGLKKAGMDNKKIENSVVASWENMGYTDAQIKKCKRSLKRILDGTD